MLLRQLGGESINLVSTNVPQQHEVKIIHEAQMC